MGDGGGEWSRAAGEAISGGTDVVRSASWCATSATLTTQRGTHRSESRRRERERVSRPPDFCRESEVVDRASGEREGVVGGRGVQRLRLEGK